MKLNLAIAAAWSFLSLLSMGVQANDVPLNPRQEASTLDGQVLQKMHEANLGEIRQGKLALDKANTKQVRDYASHLVKDHQVADRKVMQTALGLDLKLTNEPARDDVAMLQNLRNQKSGREFEVQYVKAQVDAHNQVISYLNTVKPNIQDPKVLSLVDSTLPKLQDHLTMGKQLWDGLSREQRVPASDHSHPVSPGDAQTSSKQQ